MQNQTLKTATKCGYRFYLVVTSSGYLVQVRNRVNNTTKILKTFPLSVSSVSVIQFFNASVNSLKV